LSNFAAVWGAQLGGYVQAMAFAKSRAEHAHDLMLGEKSLRQPVVAISSVAAMICDLFS
jgi:hypothetical protein